MTSARRFDPAPRYHFSNCFDNLQALISSAVAFCNQRRMGVLLPSSQTVRRIRLLAPFAGNKLESHRHILIAEQVVRDRKDDLDRLAFAHFRELRRVALRVCEERETADDLVQETYLRAWR